LGLFFVKDALDDRMRVDRAAAALVDPLFKKERVFIRRADFLGRDENGLGPGLDGFSHGWPSTVLRRASG
jgi:hypothetical protein